MKRWPEFRFEERYSDDNVQLSCTSLLNNFIVKSSESFPRENYGEINKQYIQGRLAIKFFQDHLPEI